MSNSRPLQSACHAVCEHKVVTHIRSRIPFISFSHSIASIHASLRSFTESKNIFQIWEEGSRKTPFAVRKVTWADHHYVVVERIDCEAMPYSKAYGYPTSYDQPNLWFKDDKKWGSDKLIPRCCLYRWAVGENVAIH
jgi:hypothetical protein